MKIEKYVVGMIGTNCYLVINEETKDTVMVDPGSYPAKLKNAVKEQGLKLKAVLLTHAHFDHIMGLSDVMEDIKVPVYVEEADLPMMMDGESNLSSGYMRGGYQFADAVPVRDGQQLQIAGFQFRVIHTPGHTPADAAIIWNRKMFFLAVIHCSVHPSDVRTSQVEVHQHWSVL